MKKKRSVTEIVWFLSEDFSIFVCFFLQKFAPAEGLTSGEQKEGINCHLSSQHQLCQCSLFDELCFLTCLVSATAFCKFNERTRMAKHWNKARSSDWPIASIGWSNTVVFTLYSYKNQMHTLMCHSTDIQLHLLHARDMHFIAYSATESLWQASGLVLSTVSRLLEWYPTVFFQRSKFNNTSR